MTDSEIIAIAQESNMPAIASVDNQTTVIEFARAILQAASAAPAAQNEKNPWKEAIIDEGCVTHIGWDENDPRGSLQKIIRWHVQVALDPRVSSDAQALIDSGRSSTAPAAEPVAVALHAALRSVNAVAIECGNKYGACDQIDNTGHPYQSEWLADLLAAPVSSAQPAGVPEGHKIVPIEPTEKMINVAKDERMECFNVPMITVGDALKRMYRAMISAAPSLPDDGGAK